MYQGLQRVLTVKLVLSKAKLEPESLKYMAKMEGEERKVKGKRIEEGKMGEEAKEKQKPSQKDEITEQKQSCREAYIMRHMHDKLISHPQSFSFLLICYLLICH